MADRPDPRSGVDEAGRWTPAFEGQRPPFEPGNEVAVRHGAYSKLKLGPRVDELAEVIRDDVPMVRPADEISILLLATCLAQIERGLAAIDEADAASLPTLEAHVARWVGRATTLADKLGLNPTARGRLGVDVAQARRAVTLTELAAEADEERRRGEGS